MLSGMVLVFRLLAHKKMDDLKKLALELLEIEKRYLLEGKDAYSAAVAIVVTPDGRYFEQAVFDDEEEKIAVYSSIVGRAKERRARAIITINTASVKTVASSQDLENYRWGSLQDENCPRAISLTISGPGLDAIACNLPFHILNGEVQLGKLSDFQKVDIGLLPNWP